MRFVRNFKGVQKQMTQWVQGAMAINYYK